MNNNLTTQRSVEIYKIYNALYQSSLNGRLSKQNISPEAMDALKCWCCDKLLRDCLMLKEEGFTQLAVVRRPNLFDNAPESFLKVDTEGRGMYIPLCGENGYSEA
jgi:hypothetical protein